MPKYNAFQQPIGDEVTEWAPRALPTVQRLQGKHCTLERLSSEHYSDLWDALKPANGDVSDWTYLYTDPPASLDKFVETLPKRLRAGLQPYVVRGQKLQRIVGCLSFLRIDPDNGTLELGWVHMNPAVRRTPIGTEAQLLMVKYAIDTLGYRRYEWKCDSLNSASRKAAARLGFIYEGTWANTQILKGRNRDTCWFSITKTEWPLVKASLEIWLDEANFDENGVQLRRLEIIRQSLSEKMEDSSRYNSNRPVISEIQAF